MTLDVIFAGLILAEALFIGLALVVAHRIAPRG